MEGNKELDLGHPESLQLDTGQASKFKSKIPTKMVTRSMDTPHEVEEAKRIFAAGGYRMDEEQTSSSPRKSSLELSLALERGRYASEVRAPRYGLNKYTSYDQMLDEMSAEDPFSCKTPPPKEKIEDESKSGTVVKPKSVKFSIKESIAMECVQHESTKAVIASKLPSDCVSKSTPEACPMPCISFATEAQELDHLQRSGAEVSQSSSCRAASVASNATYVLERSDSRARLVEHEIPTIPSCLSPSLEYSSEKEVPIVSPSPVLDFHSDIDVKDAPSSLLNLRTKDEREIISFVVEKVKYRRCIKFIRNCSQQDEQSSATCGCGKEFDDHMPGVEVQTEDGAKWDCNKHTETFKPSDAAFGTIQFQGFGQKVSRPPPYMRVDHLMSMGDVWHLLCSLWQMPSPKLIISVTGGAKDFKLENRLATAFKEGLIRAATTTGAWIITGGTNTGVVKYVGEAVQSASESENQMVALGIVTWGCVANSDCLEGDQFSGIFPAVYKCHNSQETASGHTPLDSNHTHFILVDDGTSHVVDAEVHFTARLQKHISEKVMTSSHQSNSEGVNVPQVLLVLGGGPNTIKMAVESIQQGTPVVFVQGSGRAADFIVKAIKMTTDGNDDKIVYPPEFYKFVMDEAKALLEKKPSQEELKKCVAGVKKLSCNKHLVTVFALGDSEAANGIDQAILHAVAKAHHDKPKSLLNLALAWNHCDFAQQEIFNAQNYDHLQQTDLQEAMENALKHNRVDFVQLFLNIGVDLRKFLTVKRLHSLYISTRDECEGPAVALMKRLIEETYHHFACSSGNKQESTRDSKILLMIGIILSGFMREKCANFYEDSKYIVPNGGLNSSPHSPAQQSAPTKSSQKHQFENPERELFIWAVFFNRKDMAELFWKTGTDHIGGALFASCIFSSLSHKATKEEEFDLSLDLQSSSKMFEELAVGVLNVCYQKDKEKAHRLLIRVLPMWGETTLLSMASTAGSMEFMGHTCCQTLLNRIWKGQMYTHTSPWKILAALLFQLPILQIKFTSTKVRWFPCGKKVEPARTGSEEKSSLQSTEPHEKATGPPHSEKVNCCNVSFKHIPSAVYFFHTAPVVKFAYHAISYIIFLGIFSFFLLTELHPDSIGPCEILVWIWCLTLVIEEGRQIYVSHDTTVKSKLRRYFNDNWNIFDSVIFALFVLCIILRCTLPFERFQWARRLYAINLIMFYVRFLHTFYVHKNIGPKVIMIFQMFYDLLFFMLILVVFIVAFGVASQAVRYPGAPLSWNILKEVLNMPYWQMYGELFLEELNGDVGSCSSNATVYMNDRSVQPCPESSWLSLILLAIYIMVINVLLLNLLIAMFSHTFERVQENSEKVWRFYRYGLVYEFFNKPTMAPPLMIVNHVYRIFKSCIRRCRETENINNDFRTHFKDMENKKLSAFEQEGLDHFPLQRQAISQECIHNKVSSNGEKINQVLENVESINEHVTKEGSVWDSKTEFNCSLRRATVSFPLSSTPLSPTSLDLMNFRSDVKVEIATMQSRLTNIESALGDKMDQMMLSLKTVTRKLEQHQMNPGPTNREPVVPQ